ncbi:cell wall elongation regulator TseB-like domain-containing protein [Bacillus sp. FJAT-45066]|uniref:cell wall elongation regulator TseB-like domain-containing protein n=1 Tax=Bacillus sp. FJAT-45066 TaxID=2011010 RepID=UPI000BB8FEFD|nr:DUF5590 domain-containing protein [Bacillus sp. FJAT-45066]
MKKWIIIILVVALIIFLWQVISIYQSTISPLKSEKEYAGEIVKNKTEIQTIQAVDVYNGTNVYHIVSGTNADNEQLIAWLNEEDEVVLMKKADEGIKKEEVLQFLNTNRTPKKIISITLAMEKNIPLWEVKFTDTDDRYHFYYIKFDDGEFFQRISF